MKSTTISLFFTLLVVCQSAPIAKKPLKFEPKKEEKTDDFNWQDKLDYNHYLTQVMNELETDKEFSNRLKEMRKNKTVKAEDLATQLSFANRLVRSKLDELKRLELKRLSELERRLDIMKAQRGDKDVPEEVQRIVDRRHLDHENPSSFEIDDLQRLIQRAVADLKMIDEKQREEFKKHEMEKEILHKRKLKHIKDEKKKQEEEKKWEESQARHNKHAKIHTPGSEAQMKEVWEKEDHMDPDDFNPHTFFKMHDVNEDGELDEEEIDALFQKELDKAYNPNDPDDDMQERYESMMEMRRRIMEKVDKNNDLRISFDELKQWTKSPEFKNDEGFQLPEEDKSKIFTDDDMKKYEQEYDREHPDDMEDYDDDGDDQELDNQPHSTPKSAEHAESHVKDPGRKVQANQEITTGHVPGGGNGPKTTAKTQHKEESTTRRMEEHKTRKPV